MTITIPSLGPYTGLLTPLNNVTPFTYRDGLTNSEILASWQDWLNTTVVGFINDNFTELSSEFVTQVNLMIDEVNSTSSALQTAVNDAIAADQAYVNTQVADDKAYVDAQIATIIGSTIAVTDPVIAGVLTASDTNTTNTELNKRFRRVVNGLVSDDATDNTTKIQAALDRGGDVILPATSGRYAVASELNITVPGTKIYARGAKLRQLTRGYALFNVNVADVTIDGVDATGSLTDLDVTGLTAPWELTIVSSRWTVINAYSGADRLNIPWIRGNGFDSVVRATNWVKGTAGTGTTGNGPAIADVVIGTVLTSNVEFGVVAQGVNRFKLDSVIGGYRCPIAGSRPPHLIYFSGVGDENVGLEIGSGIAVWEGGPILGQAYQFKGVTRGHVGSIRTDSAPGVVNILDVKEFEIDSIVSTNDLSVTTYGSISIDQTVLTNNLTIKHAKVQLAAGDGIPFRLISGDSCRFLDLDFTVNHITNGTLHDVSLGGTNNNIESVKVKNTSAGFAWRGIGLWSGDGHRIGKAVIKNTRIGIDVRSTATNAIINYDPNLVTLHPTAGVAKIMVDNAVSPTIALPQKPYGTRVRVFDDFGILASVPPNLGPAWSGQPYTVNIGTWVSDVVNNEGYESASTSRSNVNLDSGFTNVELSADIKIAGYLGVSMRGVGNDYVCAYANSAGVYVGKVEGAVLTQLGTAALALTAGRYYRMVVRIYGAHIDIYIDNVLALSYDLTGADATKYNAGSTIHGLFSSASTGASRFKSFRISNL